MLYVVFVFHVRRKRETTILLLCGWRKYIIILETKIDYYLFLNAYLNIYHIYVYFKLQFYQLGLLVQVLALLVWRGMAMINCKYE